MGIVRFIIRRLLFMVVLVIGVSILIFFMINAIGNPIDILLAERLAENPDLRGQAFNFSNEAQVTVLDLVECILALMGSDLEPEVRNEARNEIRRQYLSATKARRALGWRPLYTLEEGLQRTIDWYKDFLGVSL